MSVEGRLRTGLAANSAHLQPKLNSELGALLGRVHRRRRRRTGFGLTAAAAAVSAVLWFLGPLDRADVTLAPADPAPSHSVPVAAPTPLERMSGALPPGKYAAKFPGAGADTRAVIDVPAGFTAEGGWALSPADDGKDSGLRAIAFWTVGEVHTNPCYAFDYKNPGPSVQDLATALARQPLGGDDNPVPVSIGGYQGLYLQLSVPADLDVTAECELDVVERWRNGEYDRRWAETPGEVDRVWIIDVKGRRVVIGAVHTPRASKTQIDQLTRMVESITFTTTSKR